MFYCLHSSVLLLPGIGVAVLPSLMALSRNPLDKEPKDLSPASFLSLSIQLRRRGRT